jgi:iron complex outermembrane receptor protein
VQSRTPDYRRLIGRRVALMALLSGAAPAFAQLAGPAETNTAASSAAPLEEVVVTAERREGTVQSTPFSITAYSGAQLELQGIVDVADVGYETPGISERNSGSGQTEYEMRGISSAGGTSPTVGFYLDDVSLTPPVQALEGKVVIDPSLYDLNRVEVLRGPQGTLYGSGSMGGTIRLITNQPQLGGSSASGQLIGSGTQSGGGNYSANLMLNLPIVADTLALRVVGTETYTSGWIDRIVLNPFPPETNGGNTRGNVLAAPVEATHDNVNWERLQGVRASLLWQPMEGLTIAPSAFYQKIDQGSPNYVDQPPGVDFEAHYQPFDLSEPYSDNFGLYTLPITYDSERFEVRSITALYRRDSSLAQDTSEIAQDFDVAILGGPFAMSFPQAGPLTAYETDDTDQFSQEVRISSRGTGPFQWVLGGFYEDYTAWTNIYTSPVQGAAANVLTQYLGAPSYFYLYFKNTLKQYAGFGEASYQLGDFRLTAGLRYYSYNGNENEVQGGGLISGAGAPVVIVIPNQNSGANPKANLAYEPTKNLTLYAQIAKGFRPGGVNNPAPVTCPKYGLQYSPDSVWSYEAGEKLRSSDGTFMLNASGYYEDWDAIQQSVTLTCGVDITANAGTAHVYGAEIEAALTPIAGLKFTTGLGYSHARIASVEPAVKQGPAFSVGDRVQAVPDWTNTTSIEYTRDLSSEHQLVLRVSDIYVGSQTDVSWQLNNLPSRNLINLRAGLLMSDGLSAFLFANNLTDKRAYMTDPEEIFTFVPALNRVTTNQPRTVGLEVSYRLNTR